VTRLYRLLLLLYPASFRREFGAEMRHAFAMRCGEGSGIGGVALLWLETVPEVIGNAAAAHWDILAQDLRFARRTLSRSWGFALTAVLVSALGVGATAAAFSVTDFVLLRPLPFAQPDRLVNVWCSLADYGRLQFSPANFDDWERMDRSYSAMAAYTGFSANFAGAEVPERVQGTWATYDLLSTLGVKPAYGRDFTASDDRAGAPGTVMISNAFWKSRFGGDRGVVGRSIRLDGAPYEIIGVMPADFQFPSRDIQVWAPFRFDKASGNYQDRTNIWLNVVGRLRPGVTIAQARSDARSIAARLAQQFPVANKGLGGTANFVRDDMSQQSRLLLLVLSGAALCMLFIACANLGNLLLVRGVARGRELAVRTALGAGRERLVRQMLTETMLLVGVGCVGGVAVGVAGVPLLARLVPNDLPIAGVASVDGRVLWFACALTLATSLVFALVPAWRATRRAGLTALRDGRGAGGGRSERVRALLVAFEVTASVVLLVSTGLLLRTIVRINDVDPGFRTDGVLTMRTALAYPQYATVEARERFYAQVLDGVTAIPGVSAAAYVSWLPLTWGGGIWPAEIPGRPINRGASGSASIRYVTPGYFATLGIPQRDGRDVNGHDTQQSLHVAVVSASFADRYWPDGKALGQHFTMAFDDREVVGVVADVKVRGLDRRSEPQVYFPATQVGDSSLVFYAPKDLAIRTALPASSILPAVRAVIRAADPEQPITSVQTIAELLAAQTASRSAQLRVLAMLAVFAILLTGVGIHGLLAFAVSLRAQEIGVRMALGARTGTVIGMVLRRGLWLAAAGAIPGVVVSYFAARAMRSILYGVVPSDPLTIGAAVALVVVMTLAGSLMPARRASRIDPMRVLRSE
jgi:putative ABC transport system permease protein